jgi:hypothetical protein
LVTAFLILTKQRLLKNRSCLLMSRWSGLLFAIFLNSPLSSQAYAQGLGARYLVTIEPWRTFALDQATIRLERRTVDALAPSAKVCVDELPVFYKGPQADAEMQAGVMACMHQNGHPYAKLLANKPSDSGTVVLQNGPAMRVTGLKTADPNLPLSEGRLWAIYGEPMVGLFDMRRVLRFKETLGKLDLLSQVSVQATPTGEHTLELLVDGTPNGRNFFSGAVDYSADGPGVTARWVHGGPEWLAGKIDAALSYRPKSNTRFARIRLPLKETVSYALQANLSALHRQHPAYTITVREAHMQWTNPLTNSAPAQSQSRLSFTAGFSDGRELAAHASSAPQRTDALLTGIGFSGSKYVSAVNTRFSFQALANFKWDTTGHTPNRVLNSLQMETQTPGPHGWSFYSKLKLATVYAQDSATLPLSDRLYLGGPSDLRGFATGSIGSTTPVGGALGNAGQPGGLSQWVLTLQPMRSMHTPLGNIQFGPFLDQGSLSDTRNLNGPAYRSLGLVARAKTPLGYFDVSLGRPMGSDQTGWQLYATLGQSF